MQQGLFHKTYLKNSRSLANLKDPPSCSRVSGILQGTEHQLQWGGSGEQRDVKNVEVHRRGEVPVYVRSKAFPYCRSGCRKEQKLGNSYDVMSDGKSPVGPAAYVTATGSLGLTYMDVHANSQKYYG